MLEILGKIGFDWQVALANLINFIIIFLILKRFAFPPIKKIIADRQQKIDEGLENAKKAEAALMMADEIKNKKIEEARIKANNIIGSAEKNSDVIMADTKRKAQKAKENLVAEGEREVALAKQNIGKEVEKEMSAFIISGLEKVLKENLTPEMQKRYIQKSLNSFKTKK